MINPSEFDIKIGKKIKSIRKLKGYSQARLGRELGVSWQQVQKYESGKNKISLEGLSKLLNILEVSIDAFFDEKSRNYVILEHLHETDIEELISYWDIIEDKKLKFEILKFVRGVSRMEK